MKNILTRLLLAFALICSASADFNPGPFKIWDGTDSLEIDATGRITVLQGGSWSFSLGAAIPAGSNIIGKFGIDQTTPGTTNLVAAGQNGTWTVQPGNTPNSTAWLVTGTGGVFPASQSGTWNINNVAGTISLPTGAATAAKQPALGTAGSPSTDVLSVQGVASGTPVVQNQTQIAGTTISVNAGATDAGTQRVILANENVQDVMVTGISTTSASSNWNILATTQTTAATDCIGYRSFSVQVEGVSVTSVTANFEGSNDNTNFVAIPMYDRASPIGAPVTSPAMSGSPLHRFFDGPITFRYIRFRVSSFSATSVQCYTRFSNFTFVPSTTQIASATGTNTNVAIASGTVTTVSTLSNTTALTPGTAAANLGKQEDAASASLDTGVFMLGIRRDTLVSSTSATADYQEFAQNKYGAAYFQSYEKQMPTFSATASITVAASATDIAVLPGNATNTVYLTRITISGVQTTAGMVDVGIIKRSAADTAGTSGAMTAVPNNSANSAAVSAPLSYTANPTPGAAVGTVARSYIPVPAPATAAVNGVTNIDFGERGQPIILSGTAQQIAVNLNGVTVTGGVFIVKFEWFEAP